VLSESGVTGSSAFIGTIAYVAPEQIEGQTVDGRADQYSLACLTYECLTGRRPFERDTDIATLYAHIRDPFPSVAETLPPALAPGVDAVLSRAGAKRPADRYPSSGDMAEDLVRVTGAAAGTSPLPPASKPSEPREFNARRWATFGIVAAMAIVALGIAGFVLLQTLGPPAPVLTGHGLARIDATTGAVVAAATFDDEPTAIAADPTAAWVVHFSTGNVSRVDAATDQVTSVRVGSGPQAIVTGSLGPEGDEAYFVWVTNTTDETLSEIDADQPDRAATTLSLQFRPGGLAYAEGSLWIIDSQVDAVSHRDAQSLELVGDSSIGVGAGPVGITAGGGAVWVANGLGQSLSRIQTSLGEADNPIGLDFVPGAVAVDADAGALWIVDTDGDRVVRWDTSSRREVVGIDVGRRPVAVAVGADSVWVANASDGSVTRIDPATNAEIETIVVGGSPVGVAVSGTTVWVAVSES
jgi:YVTN family beta-propeller protein